MDTSQTGYVCDVTDSGAKVYRHELSGICVWRHAIELALPDDSDVGIIFHYASSDVFETITKPAFVSTEAWALLRDEFCLCGSGVYASAQEPAQQGSVECVAQNKYRTQLEEDPRPLSHWSDRVAFCIPILVPMAWAYDVVRGRATPAMIYGVGKTIRNQTLEGCDIWVIHCADEERMFANTPENTERRLRRAVDGLQERLGDMLDQLAELLEIQLRHEEAEPLSRSALQMREERLGATHLKTINSLGSCAVLLEAQGKPKEAETLHRRALQGLEERLGAEHPYTLTSMNNLAVFSAEQGNLEDAEQLHRKALEGREKKLGPTHSDTLTSVNNLAVLLKTQGCLEDAELLFRRALQGRDEKLGAIHPDTLSSVNSLAALLDARGQPAEAELLFKHALLGNEVKFGAKHPDTLTSMNNLAVVLEAQGKLNDAEDLHRRALQGREEICGPTHPDTINSVTNLACLLEAKGNLADAEPLYYRAQESRFGLIRIKSPEHKKATRTRTLSSNSET